MIRILLLLWIHYLELNY